MTIAIHNVDFLPTITPTMTPPFTHTPTLTTTISTLPIHTAVPTYTIIVENFDFSPASITLQKGTLVTWLWQSGYHSTTSDTNIWNSGKYSTPHSFQYQFNVSGDYPYYCVIHGAPGGLGMSGVIHIV